MHPATYFVVMCMVLDDLEFLNAVEQELDGSFLELT